MARKEVRGETVALKKAVSAYRTDIAALKRRMQGLEQQLRRVAKSGRAPAAATGEEVASSPGRFSAKGLVSLRKRLGLSAAECGLLVDASAQSVYNWEQGKVRPRAKHLPALAELRGLGKKAIRARLEALATAA